MFRRLLCLLLTLMLLPLHAVAEDVPTGVTYEIFVASFQDSDGDGVGDLRGIIQRLDYIQSLGVSRIWLMPIHPSPSYHKYDVTDYYAIAPEYGTLEDFDALVAACRERGIGVMMDLVVNHSSSEHPWFKEACAALITGGESKYLTWYTFGTDSGTVSAPHPVPGSDAWFYEGQFGYHMPDLNLAEPAVREEIARIMAFWQARGVAGFRLDAVTSYYTGANASITDFLAFLVRTARANDPDCYLVGEVWADENTILTLYGSGIDSLFNFPSADNSGRLILAALNAKGAIVARGLSDWNARVRQASPASVDAPFLSNHDLARVRGMLRSDVNRQKVAAMLYLLLPGCPTVYYGEELGMSGSGRDENKRLPMMWSAADASLNCLPPADADQPQRLKFGVDVQDADPDSLLNCYRQVIALRRLAPELHRGVMTAIDAGNEAVCFFRVDDGDRAVAVLVNTSLTEAAAVDVSAMGAVEALGGYGDPTLEGGIVTLPAISCLLVRIP